MIASAFLWATARSRPDLRRLGLVGDAVALWSRATRQRPAWTPHELRCHAVVRGVVDGLSRRRTVAVLGSGLIRDVPLDELARAFRRVILVDAVHLLPARLRARGRAVPVVADLTGVADWLAGRAAAPADPFACLRAEEELDLVISANLLSQLPRAAERRLDADPALAARLPADLPARIVAAHLDGLAGLGAPACLLSDVTYREVGRDGTVFATHDLLRGVPVPEPDERWTWEVAPRGEADRHSAYVHAVGAWRDYGRSAACGPAPAGDKGGSSR